METMYISGFCPFSQISWLWYVISVIVVFALGALWYTKLFATAWIKALEYKCSCGADLSKGEKCTCESRSMLPLVFQFISTALVGFMYFVLVPYGVWLALLVAIAISAWKISILRFEMADWKRFFTLAAINVGYFFLSSLIFIVFALI